MAVALIGGGGLDRVADRVAEVEDLALAGVALVARHDPQLHARAREHEVAVRRRRLTPAHPPPQVPAGDQAGLDDLGPAGGELLRRERGQCARIGDHGSGLVVGAGVVLALRQVDPGLAAVGRVDLRDERRGDLHDRHAALVDRRAEPRDVADHAAPERDDVVVLVHPGARERAQDAVGARERLVALARLEPHLDLDRGQEVGVARADRRIGDQEAPASQRPHRRAQQPLPHEHRVLAGPQQLRPGRRVGERADGRQGLAHLVAAVGRQDRVGQPGVERRALGVQRLEAVAVARQRPSVAAALPGGVGVDVQQHHGVAGERVAHPLRADRAAAERDHRGGRVGEDLRHRVLLLLAEGALPVAGEVGLDRRPEALLQHRVRVHRLDVERGGGAARGERLARPHEPYEDEGRRRFHPIRSS